MLGSESDLYGAELSQIQFFKPIQMLSSFSIRQRTQAGKCWVFFKCCNGAMFDLSVVCDRKSLRPKITAEMLSEVFDSYGVTAVRNTFGRNCHFRPKYQLSAEYLVFQPKFRQLLSARNAEVFGRKFNLSAESTSFGRNSCYGRNFG